MIDITIRHETEADYRIVEELTREAFWNLYVPGCDEHYLVHILRSHPDYRADLSFVAEHAGNIIGLIMYTDSYVENETGKRIKTLTFGPLCVKPAYQRKGVGKALIEHTRNIAVQNNEAAIIILGHPHNYCPSGFISTKDLNIADTDGRYPFGQLILPLKNDAFKEGPWRYHYSGVYEVDPAETDEFDRGFPPREKLALPSQTEFSIAVRAYLD